MKKGINFYLIDKETKLLESCFHQTSIRFIHEIFNNNNEHPNFIMSNIKKQLENLRNVQLDDQGNIKPIEYSKILALPYGNDLYLLIRICEKLNISFASRIKKKLSDILLPFIKDHAPKTALCKYATSFDHSALIPKNVIPQYII